MEKFSKRSIWIILTAIIAFGVGSVHGRAAAMQSTVDGNGHIASTGSVIITGIDSAPPAETVSKEDFSKFWDLWHVLQERYYKQPIDNKALLYGAMKGLAESLGDPYTVFFEPVTAQEFTQELSGKFSGIGAEIGIKDEQLQVIAPLSDTPAERAGLRAGDLLLKINSEDTVGMPVDKAVSLIRGKRGTAVSLLVGRYTLSKDPKGKEVKTPTTHEITIIRDEIVIKSVKIQYLADSIALIKISSFNQDTNKLFSNAVQEALAKGTKGIIIDLRNNPGGYLEQAIAISSEWTGDAVVVKEQRQGKIVEEYYGNPTARLKTMPTVILMNDGSASASEIVAGALQDYKKATIVGIKSFGKGSVQDYHELADGSAVKVTIAEWLTPNDRSINKQGIEPDVKVEQTLEDYNAKRDPQLDASVKLLTGKSATTTTSSKAPQAGASSTRR